MKKNVRQKENTIKMAEPISIVAHQLKNPVSVLKGYIEVLLQESLGNINAKQREYLTDAMQILNRMEFIISDLLDVSRIEEHRYEIKLQQTDIVKITQEVINDFSLWIKASNCEVNLLAAKVPFVLADSLKIRQVIENFISNAIKYKLSGFGKIDIAILKKQKKVLFQCRDNGIGIPKKDFKKVFSKFYRSEDAMKIDPSGIGLGLYIDKAIVEISGGEIWFKKNKNNGMTFCFSLPIA